MSDSTGGRDGCRDEDKLTAGIDTREDNDGLVATKILICDNGTENGSNITLIPISLAKNVEIPKIERNCLIQ